MGGAESEIGDGTTRVFLESAWFQPTVVRKQAKRLGLSTDSSYRFERGIDPFMHNTEEIRTHIAGIVMEEVNRDMEKAGALS
jgi:phenylalanyl-tRNA synthetase beta chain